jgi:DNA-3-methyladenine glycosylase II
MPILRLPEPFSFELSTERFRAFGVDLANLWHEEGLQRVVRGKEVRIEEADGGVAVEPLDPGVEAEVRFLLGEPYDLAGFAAWAAGDEVLRPLVARLAGFRPPLLTDPWEMLVGSITAQQVSMFAAVAIRNRFIERYGERHELAYAFPTRDRVAGADEDELFSLGFSRRKAEYVLGLARSDLDLDGLDALSDEEVRAAVTAQRGLGEWTADWFLARHLARPTAWPSGDLAVRKAVENFYGDVGDVRAFGARFAPFQNLAAHYLLLGLRAP